MGESRQRLACRLAFLIICTLPTAIVIWLAVSPGRTAHWESTVQDGLGFDAEIESVTTPLPGVTELHHVSLRDLQKGHVLDLAEIKLARSLKGTQCHVSEFNIDIKDLGTMLGHVNSLLERKMNGKSFGLRVERIHLGHRNPLTNRILRQTLEDCELLCQKTATGKRIAFDFKLSANDDSPCQLTIEVEQSIDKSLVKWRLKTNEQAIPCWLISGWIEQFALLGDDCTFSGNATGGLTAGKPHVGLEGTFDDLDLGRLVQQSFPHELSGLAKIEVAKCIVTDQGILKAEGRMLSKKEGLIGPSLLAAASQYLSMKTPQGLPSEQVSFSQFEFRFETVNKTQITNGAETRVVEISIQGDDTGNLILDSYGFPLLGESGLEHLPIANVLQTLLPDGQQHALSNPQCRQLLALFPSNSRTR